MTCNIRGRVFTAVVKEKVEGGLVIEPPPGINYYRVKSRQVERVVRRTTK